MKVYTSTEYFGEGSGIVIKAGSVVIDLYKTERARFSYRREGLDTLVRIGMLAIEVTRQSLIEA